MVTALYVTSTETFSGKTAVCIGLARRFLADGLRVGYFKPLSFTARQEDCGAVDEDTQVIRRTLGLKEPPEIICPVLITPRLMEVIARGEAGDLIGRIKAAYSKVAEGKDVVIIEGANNIASGSLIDMSGLEVLQAFDAKGIVVVRYRDDLVIDHILIAKRVAGERAIGAVINSVPADRLDFVTRDVAPFCERRGIKVFAILPQERQLMATSVNDLVEYLGGEVLCAQDRLNELVENVMVGAMGVDAALKYFRRKPNKAVITGGDRSDLQLAALETSTKCLILTGSLHPNPIVVARAEELGVPMILVRHDTLTAVGIVERCSGRVRFHDVQKIARFEEMLQARFDYQALYQALHIAPKGSSK